MKRFDPFRLWRGPFHGSTAEKAARFAPAVLYLCAIFIVSSIPGQKIPVVVSDKLAHFVEYFVFAALLLIGAAGLANPRTQVKHFIATWGFTLAYAASDEWHQAFVPHRSASVWDFIADMLGATVALGIIAAGIRGTVR